MTDLTKLTDEDLLQAYDDMEWMEFTPSSDANRRYHELRAEILRLMKLGRKHSTSGEVGKENL